jgi:hypothetical protein
MKFIHLPFSLLTILILSWQLYISSAYAQWSTDANVNNVICDATLDQVYPKIVSDGSGGAIMTWHDRRTGNTDENIYGQRINSSGVVQWTVNGATLCDTVRNQTYPSIASDGSGGAIIAWNDQRDVSLVSDIYAQRINSSGDVQWTANGIPICNTPEFQHTPIILSDGSGGAIIAWNDSRDGGANTNIYAQKINSSGDAQWPVNGIPICNVSGEEQFLSLVSDGSGGAIIIWEDGRDGGSFNDIYAQRINSAGVIQWTSNGVALSNDSSSVIPTSTSDGSGGAIITWMDNRNGIANHIYAQRIDSTGDVKWTVNGVAICTAQYGGSHPTITSDGSGGAIITWEDLREGALNFDIYVQKINASGAVQWTENGVAICTATGNQVVPTIVSDGSGGEIITWGDKRGGGAYGDIYAQKINSSGVVQWAVDGVAISTAARDQNTPTIISDGLGGAIITWGDDRNHFISSFDIYTQQVNANGDLGVVAGVAEESGIVMDFALLQNYPNPFNPSTTISWQAPVGSWQTLKVYDLMGNEVATLVNEYIPAGSYEIEFAADNLPSGIYFYQIRSRDFVQTKKMIYLK